MKRQILRQRVNQLVLIGVIATGLAAIISLVGVALSASAQRSQLGVYLTEVDATSFPDVEVQLAVTDSSGQSINDLQIDQIQIQEDNEPNSGRVTVEPMTLNDLQLVLALDVSMSTADLDRLKHAAQTVLADFAGFDCLALISFGDKVTGQTQCTNNLEALQTALDGLQPEQNLTKLHEAIQEAAKLIEPNSPTRRAVILIADRHDNANTVSLAQAISQAQETEAPFYIIGFGDKVQAANNVKTEIASTGGRYLAETDISQVEPALQQIIADLRRGYRLTFRSRLTADNDVHSFNLQITHPQGTGQVAGQFTAVPNKVSVTLPEDLGELRIKGSLLLSPTIISPAPVASVTYNLDGRLLVEQTGKPFAYTWDNTPEAPGQHTLTVTVVDSAGNKGETEALINLAKPLSIAEVALPATIPYGEAFTVAVTGTTGVQIESAALLIDTQVITPSEAAGDSSLFVFNVDTTAFTSGAHQISLRATDMLGQSAEKNATITFVLPAAKTWLDVVSEFLQVSMTTLRWGINLSIDLLIALLALLLILCLFLINWIIISRTRHVHQKIARKRYVLDITNKGNIDSHYELWADDPAKLLKFEFTLDGNRLPHRSKEEPVETDLDRTAGPVDEPIAAPNLSTSPVTPAAAAASEASRPVAAPAQGQAVQQNTAKAGTTGRKIKGFITPLAGALRTAGRLLGPFGGPLRQIGGSLTAGQSAVQRVAQKPKQFASQSKQLSKQIGQLAPSAAAAPARPATQPLPQTTEAMSPSVAPITPPAQLSPVAANTAVPLTPVKATPPKRSQLRYHSIANPAQTLKVPPGRSLSVEVWVTPPSPYKPLRSPFTLYAQPVEQIEPLVDQPGLAEIRGLNWIQRWWLLTVASLMTLFLVGGTGYLAYWAIMNLNFLGLLSL